MDPDYAAAYPDLAARHWWWRARESLLINEIRALRGGKSAGRILDIGCGDGRLFPALGEFGDVEGIEPDAATLGDHMPNARRIHHVPFCAPLPLSGQFDLILMLDVLEHVDDPVQSLELVRSLLAPDGVVLITVPALPVLWTRHDDLNHHKLRYSRQELRQQLRSAGFSVRQMRFEFHLLAVVKLIVRLLERLGRAEPTIPRVPSLLVNQTAIAFLRIESVVLRPVSQWLPGSSLLAIAGVEKDRMAEAGAVNSPSD